MKLHFVYCLARGVPLNGWTRQHRPVPSSVRRTRWGMLIMGECPQPSSNFTIYYAFLHFHSCLILCVMRLLIRATVPSVKPNIPYGQSSARLPVIQSFLSSRHSNQWVIRMITFNVATNPITDEQTTFGVTGLLRRQCRGCTGWCSVLALCPSRSRCSPSWPMAVEAEL